jgi:hypothetical protein
MSNRDLATGVFRAWGVMWWIYVLVSAPQFLNVLLRRPYIGNDSASAGYFLSSQAISVGCQVVVALFLTRRASWLASVVFPTEQPAGFSFGAEDLQGVLFSIVGLYFILDGARHALGSGYQLIVRPSSDPQNAAAYLWRHDPENLVRAAGGILGGTLLFFGSRGLQNLWGRYKRGPGPIEESTDTPDA